MAESARSSREASPWAASNGWSVKSANSFAFYLGPLTAKIHRVEVKAQALIECRTNGSVAPCPQATLDGYTNAQTMAAIGKSTLMLEEQQNFGSQ